ncbi:hypothetical protein ACFC0M_00945 [Streptomyces sp. NPDC056149]|uniref:hypothetical protein n=1 Tax=unclassified Streptomyces TaxID=2593676 RepID=UPI002380E40A|nr:hypothetical protein [Streptomyces sp. WZ-12]
MTVENAISQAMKTWHRLGVDEEAAQEMAEELAADLTAAVADGRSVSAYVGGDVDALVTSWAVEHGLLPVQHRRLKETGAAAAKGAAVPALAAVFFCLVSMSHLLDPCALDCRTTTDAPWMWVGWVLCAAVGYWLVLRAVSRRLERHQAAGREATRRALTRTLPVIVMAAALIGGGIGLLFSVILGYFQIFALLPALASMPAAVAVGAAWVRHCTCPPVNTMRRPSARTA